MKLWLVPFATTAFVLQIGAVPGASYEKKANPVKGLRRRLAVTETPTEAPATNDDIDNFFEDSYFDDCTSDPCLARKKGRGDGGGKKKNEDFELLHVTLNNLAQDQPFGPFFTMTHYKNVSIFGLGEPASAALQDLAENCNPQALVEYYTGMSGVFHAGSYSRGSPYSSTGPFNITVPFEDDDKYFTIASCLMNTNDGFVAFNGVKFDDPDAELLLAAYDAGTEENNQDCASIGGPACSAVEGNVASGNGEGRIRVHSGVYTGGGLDPRLHDWKNPIMSASPVEEIKAKKIMVATNYAYAGAMSSGDNRVTFCNGDIRYFQLAANGALADCAFYNARQDELSAVGLVNLGLQQQLVYAQEDKVFFRDAEKNLYFVMLGTNDFYGPPNSWTYFSGPPIAYNGADPDLEYEFLTAAWTVKNIQNGIQTLVNNGAKYIVLGMPTAPCEVNLPSCRTESLLQNFPGQDGFIRVSQAYSTVWTNQLRAGLMDVALRFNQDSAGEVQVIFVDFPHLFQSRFSAPQRRFTFDETCREYYENPENEAVLNEDGIGYDCFQYAFLDEAHFTSEFVEDVMDEAADYIKDQLPGKMKFDRVIAIGDSQLDNGSFNSVLDRTGQTYSAQYPPYLGKASNKYTFVEWLEIYLNIDPTEPYIQTASLTV